MSRIALMVALASLILASSAQAADEPLFSGPQPGEKLTPFEVVGVYDQQEGQELNFVAAAAGKPILLIFMHDLTRPSAALTKALCAYAQPRAGKGLHCGVVWLSADRSQAEEYLKRARGSLNLRSPVGVSPDGIEGPGSYGLNRKVALTVLVGQDNKVTANFALVQPALADGPKILAEVARLLGEEPPTLAEVEALVRPAGAGNADQLRGALRSVIRKDATEQEVAAAAASLERMVAQNRALQRELGQMAYRVVQSGNLAKYGTPAAQEHLRRWAEKYGPKE